MLCFSSIKQVFLARNCNYLLNSSCLEEQDRSEGLTVPEKPELWERGVTYRNLCCPFPVSSANLWEPTQGESGCLNFCDKRRGSTHTARKNSVLPAAEAAITSIPFLF